MLPEDNDVTSKLEFSESDDYSEEEEGQYLETEHKYAESDSSLEEECGEEEEISDSPTIFYEGELRETIIEEEKDIPHDNTNILEVATDFFRNWRGYDGRDGLLRCFQEWMMGPIPDFAQTADTDIEMWETYMFSDHWREFAKECIAIITTPCSEVHNERCFSLKRHVIGRYSVRSSPDLITARTRILME